MRGSKSKPRVAWVALQPAPYNLPIFEALHDSGQLDIHFLFSAIKAEQPWSIERYKRIIAPASYGRWLPIGPYGFNLGVARALIEEPWDVMMIAGYASPTMQAAILTCFARCIPFIMQVDTTLLPHRRWWNRVMRRTVLYPMLRRSSATIGLGSETLRYWRHVGIPAGRIFHFPTTGHLDRFRTESLKHAARRSELRQELGVSPESLLGIYAGRLAAVKGLDLLLGGLAMLDPARRPHLLVVGDGPQQAELQRISAQRSLPVTFAGFRQNDALIALYAASDFFVLPSQYEPWGVVVAEAMAAGLPVVLSDQVGAAYDLLEEGANGFLVRGETADAWHDALERCLSATGDLKAMGERSRAIASSWNCETSVVNFLKAVEVVLGKRPGS